ncbi:MAG: hypothetical protein IH841_03680 [Thaumarchaeota archaeon]|nr:hypothetical protein [Nitrososphaerota archaeon]
MFDPQEIIYKESREIMNKKFLELVKKERPDFIFLYLVYEEFDLETIVKIKIIDPKIKIINFSGEENDIFDNMSIHRLPFIDYFFIIQDSYIKDYKNPAIEYRPYTAGFDSCDEFKNADLRVCVRCKGAGRSQIRKKIFTLEDPYYFKCELCNGGGFVCCWCKGHKAICNCEEIEIND